MEVNGLKIADLSRGLQVVLTRDLQGVGPLFEFDILVGTKFHVMDWGLDTSFVTLVEWNCEVDEALCAIVKTFKDEELYRIPLRHLDFANILDKLSRI